MTVLKSISCVVKEAWDIAFQVLCQKVSLIIRIGQYIDMGVGKFRIQGIEHHQGKCRLYGTFVSEDEMLLTMFLPR